MTVLEDNVKPFGNKLSLKKRLIPLNPDSKKQQALKRKGTFQQMAPAKKQISEEMLNGYRTNETHHRTADAIQECPVATLSNMGNTCFLNSVLYTLRFAPTFLHNLHHLVGDLALVNSKLSQNKAKSSSLGRNITTITGPSSRSTSSKDLLSLGSSSDIIPKSKVQIVTEKLHELFMTMHNLEMKECTEAYQPVAFLQAVREANFIFEGNNQQDAHELLVYLFDNIRETCNLLMQQVQHNPDLLNETESAPTSNNQSMLWISRRSWKKFNKKKDKTSKEPINEEHVNGACVTDTEDASSNEGAPMNSRKKVAYNFVSENFEGVTLRRTKCLECECVTERKETFYDIPVPILFKQEDFDVSPSEIYRRACVTSEKLCDSNKYLCEKCKRYNEASREVSFERLPNIMVLQLKRFTTTVAGVQKVNSYLPTPLELACFCETCCQMQEGVPQHRYQLCCVIMHLGGTMASGHYIAYVRATDHFADYMDCTKDLPKGSLSASSSEKSLSILKYLKPKALSGSVIDSRNGLPSSKSSVVNGLRMCKSTDCCGVKLNKNIVENVINSYAKKNGQEYWQTSALVQEEMWLECDDENVRPISSQELQDLLGYKPNSTSTPYLLFYSKVTDSVD